MMFLTFKFLLDIIVYQIQSESHVVGLQNAKNTLSFFKPNHSQYFLHLEISGIFFKNEFFP